MAGLELASLDRVPDWLVGRVAELPRYLHRRQPLLVREAAVTVTRRRIYVALEQACAGLTIHRSSACSTTRERSKRSRAGARQKRARKTRKAAPLEYPHCSATRRIASSCSSARRGGRWPSQRCGAAPSPYDVRVRVPLAGRTRARRHAMQSRKFRFSGALAIPRRRAGERTHRGPWPARAARGL